MSSEKNISEASSLNPRNRSRKRYDIEALCKSFPELKTYVVANKGGDNSVNFSDPKAVKALNRAILKKDYGIDYWEFPDKNLCPAIPGRAEYIHHIADLLAESNSGQIPSGKNTVCVDIGVGASCIYPIIGVIEYGWQFIGSDVSRKSIKSAQNIVDNNPVLKENVKCVLQNEVRHIFKGVIERSHKVDVSICNPPFHSSRSEAKQASLRKVKNLTGEKNPEPQRNFSGNYNELIYQGGELKFIYRMVAESQTYAKSILWFTSLISKEATLKKVRARLNKLAPEEVKVFSITTGNKTSRIIAWTFHDAEERNRWSTERWRSEM